MLPSTLLPTSSLKQSGATHHGKMREGEVRLCSSPFHPAGGVADSTQHCFPGEDDRGDTPAFVQKLGGSEAFGLKRPWLLPTALCTGQTTVLITHTERRGVGLGTRWRFASGVGSVKYTIVTLSRLSGLGLECQVTATYVVWYVASLLVNQQLG